MNNVEAESSGIVEKASKKLGSAVGTAALLGRRTASVGAAGVAAVGSLLSRPFKDSASAEDEEEVSVPEEDHAELLDEPVPDREVALGNLVAALEADLETARREVHEARRGVDQAEAQPVPEVGGIGEDAEPETRPVECIPTEAESDEQEESFFPIPSSVETAGAASAFSHGMRSDEAEETWSQGVGPLVAPPPEVETVRGGDVAVEEDGADRASDGPAYTEDGIPQHVTAEEVAAAEFVGAAERVMIKGALKDLANRNPMIRVRAVRVLGRIRHELSVRSLSACLIRDMSLEVRAEALSSLVTLGTKESLPALVRALSDRSSRVRLAAVRGVYHLAGAEAADLLIPVLSDENEDVRRRVVSCLGWTGLSRVATHLKPLLRDGSVLVRLAVLEAMGNMKSSVVMEEIIGLLRDPDESVRQKAYRTLLIITGREKEEARLPKSRGELDSLIARCRAWREEVASR